MSSEPTTAAGRALLRRHHKWPITDFDTSDPQSAYSLDRESIAAIEAEARATAEAEIGRLQRQRAQWLRLHTVERDRLRTAITDFRDAGKDAQDSADWKVKREDAEQRLYAALAADASEWADTIEGVPINGSGTRVDPTPASSRFLDLDARLAAALDEVFPEAQRRQWPFTSADLAKRLAEVALKEDRREPGDTSPEKRARGELPLPPAAALDAAARGTPAAATEPGDDTGTDWR